MFLSEFIFTCVVVRAIEGTPEGNSSKERTVHIFRSKL